MRDAWSVWFGTFSGDDAIGVVFCYAKPQNYYRFAMNAQDQWQPQMVLEDREHGCELNHYHDLIVRL